MDIIYLALIIITAIGVLIYFANKQPQFNPAEAKKVQETLKKDMELEQLRQYDGVKNERVLLALKGHIFDVSSSEFYRPGGSYHVFAGYDASINLAKMSHDKEFLNKFGEINLGDDESGVLNDWYARFTMKYPLVGNVTKASI